MAHFVATDLHGKYELWEGIKKVLKPEDVLYYLGDAIDRGPRGWELMVELMNDPRVIYLKGNHEDLMYNSYRYKDKEIRKEFLKDWKKNGGDTTINQIAALGISEETLNAYLDKIDNLPIMACFTNPDQKVFYLSHAGFNPDNEFLDLDAYNQELKMTWDRKHFFREWPQDMKSLYIVHGHTPIHYCVNAMEFIDNVITTVPFVYANGHKINLDISSATTNTAILYNLDKDAVAAIIQGENNDEHTD